MKYLENAFKFLGKFFLLLIPLFVATAIPSIISGPSNNTLQAQLNEIRNALIKDPTMIQSTSDFFELYGTLASALPFMLLVGLISIILGLIARPATYGMVNKALDTGNADLSDFLPELGNNIGKYILMVLASIGIYLGIGIAAAIIFAIFVGLMAVSKVLGIVLMILFAIALIIGLLVFSYLTVLWFPAMVSDNLGVFDGLKKSISVAKSYFWPIVGISILVAIGSGIVSAILGLFQNIPVIGPILLSAFAVLVEFIMIVFYFEVYRDKTGKNDDMNGDLSFEVPGDYL